MFESKNYIFLEISTYMNSIILSHFCSLITYNIRLKPQKVEHLQRIILNVYKECDQLICFPAHKSTKRIKPKRNIGYENKIIYGDACRVSIPVSVE